MHSSSIQVIHYGEAQRYGAHYDAYTKDSAKGRRTTADGGNRLLTVLVYLNAVPTSPPRPASRYVYLLTRL
jgi:hypothetical protein